MGTHRSGKVSRMTSIHGGKEAVKSVLFKMVKKMFTQGYSYSCPTLIRSDFLHLQSFNRNSFA